MDIEQLKLIISLLEHTGNMATFGAIFYITATAILPVAAWVSVVVFLIHRLFNFLGSTKYGAFIREVRKILMPSKQDWEEIEDSDLSVLILRIRDLAVVDYKQKMEKQSQASPVSTAIKEQIFPIDSPTPMAMGTYSGDSPNE